MRVSEQMNFVEKKKCRAHSLKRIKKKKTFWSLDQVSKKTFSRKKNNIIFNTIAVMLEITNNNKIFVIICRQLVEFIHEVPDYYYNNAM